MRNTLAILMLIVAAAAARAGDEGPPAGYWSLDQARAVLDKTRQITLSPDLGHLSPWSDLFEELKADLVSLHTAPRLRRAGLLDERTLRSIYASGVRRVLQRV